jgi:hypothetical protein
MSLPNHSRNGKAGRPGFIAIDNAFFDEHAAKLGPFAFTVYCCLRRHLPQVWPSYLRIAKETGMSRRSAIAAVARLAEAGLVRVEPRRSDYGNPASNRYLLPGVVQEMHHPVQEMHQGGAGDALGVVQEMHQGGAGDAPEEEQEKKTKEKKTEVKKTNTPPYPPQAGGESECVCDPRPSNGKRRPRNLRRTASPEMTAAAEQVVAYYQETVRPRHPERGGVKAVLRQLEKGVRPDEMKRAADGYGAFCRCNDISRAGAGPYMRLSVRAFYGEDGALDQFVREGDDWLRKLAFLRGQP